MTITYASAGSVGEHASDASIVLTPGGANQYDWLAVIVAADNAGTAGVSSISGISDTKGLAWTQREVNNQTGGVASDGATCAIYTAEVGAAGFSGSDTVTVTFSPNTAAKVLLGYRVIADTNKFYSFQTSDSGNQFFAGFTPSVQWQIGAVVAGDVLIWGMASEGNFVPTDYKSAGADENGDNPGVNCHGLWSAARQGRCDTTTGTTHMSAVSQLIPITANGNCGWTMGFGESNDRAYAYVTLRENTATVPTAPGTPSVTPNAAGGFGLSWSAPSSDGHRSVSDYNIQWSTDNSNWNTYGTVGSAATSVNVTGFGNGTLYYFRVAAINSVGTGSYGGSASATSWNFAGAPTSLGVTQAGGGTYNLAWTAPASNGGTAVTDYRIEYRQNGGAWTLFSDPVSTTTSTGVSGLNQTDLWEFRVAAINAVGYTNFSNIASSDNTAVAAGSVSGIGTTQPPSIRTDSKVSVSTVLGTSTVGVITTTISNKAAPNTVLGTGTTFLPTRTAGSRAFASALFATGTVVLPNRLASSIVTPSTVIGNSATLAPIFIVSQGAAPAAVTGFGSVAQPGTFGSSWVSSPPTVVGVGAVFAPTFISLSKAAPPSVAGTGTVQSVSIKRTALVLASTVTGLATFPPATIVFPTVRVEIGAPVMGLGAVFSATITASSKAQPSVVLGVSVVSSSLPLAPTIVEAIVVFGVGITFWQSYDFKCLQVGV